MESIGATDLLAQASLAGLKVALEGGEVVVRGPRTAETLAREILARKEEVTVLLSASDLSEAGRRVQLAVAHRGVRVSEDLGPCPHCREPLLVFSHPEEDRVGIQCPSGQEGLYKLLKVARDEITPAICSDCGNNPALITSRCALCIQRLMLCPCEPCPKCEGTRYWRHKANKDKPAGFAWHCGKCRLAPGRNIVWYNIEG